jgi:hypothetical protein
MIRFNATLHSTRDYKQLQRCHALYISLLHMYYGSQLSLVVSWQRIYNGLTVTAAHVKSSFHRMISFLPLLNPLRLPSPERDRILDN